MEVGRKMLDWCKCENTQAHPYKCLKEIFSEKVLEFSKTRYNKAICFDCQAHNLDTQQEAVLKNDCKHTHTSTVSLDTAYYIECSNWGKQWDEQEYTSLKDKDTLNYLTKYYKGE